MLRTMDLKPSEPKHQKPHPALMQFDILKIIFEHFDPGCDSNNAKTYKGHLYSAALACKAFLDPALDSLWRSMTTLLPLLKLLPALKRMNGTYVICDGIRDEHWAHMDSYGRRVRELIVGAQEPSIALNTYLQLIQLRNSPLLPNLRQLRLRVPNPKLNPCSISDATMALSHSLESLEINDTDQYQNHNLQPFLFMVVSKALRLRHLTLHGSGDFWVTLKQLSLLSSLVISKPITFLQFWRIGTLPQLRYFTANLTGVSEASYVFPPSLAPSGFAQLQFLSITGRLPVISSIIERINSDRLRDLHISTGTMGDPIPGQNQWSVFLQRVDRKWGRVICSLSLEQETSFSTTDLPDFSRYRFELRRLSLRGWTVSDDQLAKLVAPFAGLLELRLTGGDLSHKTLTPSGLHALAKACPQLVLLEAALEADPVLDNVDHTVMSHGLMKLLVTSRNRVVVNARLLARHLDRLFPHVAVEPSPDVIGNEGWRKVNCLLSIFQEIRRDERIRRGDEW